MQWRLAEVTATNATVATPAQLKLEWDPVWDSGVLSNFVAEMQVPAVVAVPGHLYRARVRHLDKTGRWSNWSLPVEFSPVAVDLVSGLRNSLRFSEIMYNPPSQSSSAATHLH
jgi:hypothetical protein